MAGMLNYTDEPRWTYSKPTEKPQVGKPKNLGTERKSYNLPAIDVQSARRNFPGYSEAQCYTLTDMRRGDYSGTTETDSQFKEEMLIRRGYPEMDAKGGPTGYTKIYQTSGGTGRPWKSTSKRS